MGETLRRVQMLIEPEQHAVLVHLAEREGRSVAEVTRRAIALGLERMLQDDLFAARARALQHADDLIARSRARTGRALDIDVAEDLRELREERDDEIARSY